MVEVQDPAIARCFAQLLGLRLRNRVGAIDHRLRRFGRMQRRLAQADGPVIQPIAALLGDERVGQTVRLIA